MNGSGLEICAHAAGSGNTGDSDIWPGESLGRVATLKDWSAKGADF